MVGAPGDDGSLGRFEFVAACEALLADAPGCGSPADLHELFDILDPQGSGQVNLQEFSRLLQAYRQVPKAVDGHAAAMRLLEEQETMPLEPGPGLMLSPLAGLRAWMLQNAWIFYDLEALLGEPRGELEWSDFAGRLLARVRTPWLTRQGVAEIFAQLKVRASLGHGPVVRVPDLVQALLGSEDFAVEAARRVLRVVAREAKHRGQDVGKLCLAADTKRVGSLDLKQLSSVLCALCPQMLAEADVGLLFWRFSGGGGFSYQQLQDALKEERAAAAEHLLLRAMPVLIDRAVDFQAAAKVHDADRNGRLTSEQLRAALSQLKLSASVDMMELDDFAQLLAEACKKDASNFEYASLVVSGVWKGPSVEEAIATVCGEPADPAPPKPTKRHLLSILYYKTAEVSKKLGLSRRRAFEGLDRGNKGFLSAEDLRAAVLQVVGGDETLTLKDLGLTPASRLSFADFEKRLNFDFRDLAKHLGEVFSEEAVIAEPDFLSRLQQLAGIDKATSQTWVQLMYPDGLPGEGVGRSACEIFLATTPAAATEGARPVASGPDLRAELMKDGEAVGVAGQLPSWVASARAKALLKSRFNEKEAEAQFQLVAEASSKYAPPGPEEVIAGLRPGTSEAAVRSETLLLCTELGKVVEHVLEVSFKSFEGFEKAAEVFWRYACHGTGCVADVPAVDSDFKATHVFGLTSTDSLSKLFEGRDAAITIQALVALKKGERRRPLATAAVPGSELRDFLLASCAQKPRPEVVLGSRKAWTLSFEGKVTGGLELTIHHRRRSLESTSPLPWSSSFAGRLVACRKGVIEDEPEEAAAPVAEPPPAGSVVFRISLSGLILRADALRGLVARCLQGQLLPAPGSAKGLASKAPQLFLRLCLFPQKPKMVMAGCGWVESSLKPVPEQLLGPKTGDAEVSFDFRWSSPALEAMQAVEALQDGQLTLEVWIRHPVADLRLSEKSLALQPLLEAMSPEDATELRMRTLQPMKLDLSAAFERDGKPLASLLPGSLVELQLPNGPGLLSWLVEKPKPKPKVETPMRADFTVTLREVLVSGDFVAHLVGEEDVRAFVREERHTRKKEMPLFYLEMQGQGDGPFRSPPVRGFLDGHRWLRITCGDDTALGMPGRFIVNTGPEGEDVTRKRDANLLRGDMHKLSLRLLQVGGSGARSAAQAEIQLPIGWHAEGVPSPYFGGHVWVALRHTSPERPWTSVIGRALLQVQAERSRPMENRLLQRLPVAPAGLFLPLYKDWQNSKIPTEAPPEQWPLEAAVKIIAGGELWQRLTSAQSRINAIPSSAFQAILTSAAEQVPSVLFSSPSAPSADSSAQRARLLQTDLAFLSAVVAPFMADPEMLVPIRQLLLWLSFRTLARWVLPIGEGLVQRLSQLDLGDERGRLRESSGAVSLATFQTVLQEELRRAGMADLPAALWQLISQRTEWQVGGPWHFDYLLFLWDLQAACGDGSGPCQARTSSLPEPKVMGFGSLALTIHQAFHLPQISGSTSAFVSYSWRCDTGFTISGPDGVLGSTAAMNGSSPAWSYTVCLDLPEVSSGAASLPYPEAFRHLFLELSVFHSGRTSRDDLLIGTAEISLVPLKSGYEVDGYFHVLAEDVASGGSRIPRGQLRVSVSASLETPARGSPREPEFRRHAASGRDAKHSTFLRDALHEAPDSQWLALEPLRPWPERRVERLWAPGVENDVSETALRCASKLSDTELQLRSLGGSEEEQLRQLRARHRENLESLGMLQKSMLLPEDRPDESFRSFRSCTYLRPPRLASPSALEELAAASAPAALATELPCVGAGPLPRVEGDEFGAQL